MRKGGGRWEDTTCTSGARGGGYVSGMPFWTQTLNVPLLLFSREFDIVRLTAETNLRYFVLTLESNQEMIASDDAVENASSTVFELFRKVREIDEKYGRLTPR